MTTLVYQPTRSSTTIGVVAAALMAMGVVMVFSTTASLETPSAARVALRDPAVKQALFTVMALVVVLATSMIPTEFWRLRGGSIWQPAVMLLLAAIALCAVVLVPGIGTVRNGARRWLSLGSSAMGLGFQPSELAKLAVVIFLAAYGASRGERMRSFWRGLLPGMLMVGVPAALVGKEDFGTAAMIGAVGVAMLLTAGARWWQMGLCALPGVAGMVGLVWFEPYRMQRLMSFRNIWDDPLGKGYHQVQSLMTIASGGWWGLGLGNGVQKYGYLPEARTDFIFAIICEELGLIGGAAVIGLFLVLVWQGRRAMLNAPDGLRQLIAFGATLTIGMQAAMNIAVVTVSVPTKGISLPLVSAGGSGVIFLGALLGTLVSAAKRPVALRARGGD